jgi:hypothetical protein
MPAAAAAVCAGVAAACERAGPVAASGPGTQPSQPARRHFTAGRCCHCSQSHRQGSWIQPLGPGTGIIGRECAVALVAACRAARAADGPEASRVVARTLAASLCGRPPSAAALEGVENWTSAKVLTMRALLWPQSSTAAGLQAAPPSISRSPQRAPATAPGLASADKRPSGSAAPAPVATAASMLIVARTAAQATSTARTALKPSTASIFRGPAVEVAPESAAAATSGDIAGPAAAVAPPPGPVAAAEATAARAGTAATAAASADTAMAAAAPAAMGAAASGCTARFAAAPVLTPGTAWDCNVCMSAVPVEKMVEVHEGHAICVSCFRAHVQASIADGNVPVGCPCCPVGGSFVPQGVLRGFLDARQQAALAEAEVRYNGGGVRLVKCPVCSVPAELPLPAARQPGAALGSATEAPGGAAGAPAHLQQRLLVSCSECQFSFCATCQAEAGADDPCACTRTVFLDSSHALAARTPQLQAAAEPPSAPAWNEGASTLPEDVLLALRKAAPPRAGAGGDDTAGDEDLARLLQESLIAEARISGVDCRTAGEPASLASAFAAGTVALGSAEADTSSDALLAAALAEADADGSGCPRSAEETAARAAQEAVDAEVAARLAAEDDEQAAREAAQAADAAEAAEAAQTAAGAEAARLVRQRQEAEADAAAEAYVEAGRRAEQAVRCPACGVGLERVAGCDHVEHRPCPVAQERGRPNGATVFCWRCKVELGPDRVPLGAPPGSAAHPSRCTQPWRL